MEKKEESAVQVERRSSILPTPPSDDDFDFNFNYDSCRRMSECVPNLTDLTQDAKAATAAEHAMSVTEALKLYPKAVGFSMLLSLALVMEGYDNALIGAFFGLPQFQERFGNQLADGTYQLTAAWQAGLQNGATVGELIGLFGSGFIYDRYGYRKTMLGALVLITCCVFVPFFAQNIATLLAGEVLCGIAWGVFQTQTTTYAAEVTPVPLRAYLTSYVNLCWVMGQFIAAGVTRGLLNTSGQWAYRIPFAIQWVWPVPIIIGILFAPESPWWLVRKDRLEEAKKALLRLTTTGNESFNADQTIAMMVHTNELEKQIVAGTRYRDCFKGTDLRRTEIACCVWMIQVFCGIWLGGAGAYFYEQAGFSPQNAFNLGLAGPALGVIGTIVSWFLMLHLGRRTLYIWGLAVQLALLLSIGFLAVPAAAPVLSWATGSLMFMFVFVFDVTVGPVCYSLVAEIPSNRLRIKTVVLARCCYNVACLLANTINPRMLNPSAWDLKGKSGFPWAACCLLSLVWCYFRLPEPKGLTYCELDILFENKASARKFRKFRVLLEESGYFSVTSPIGSSG